MFCTQDYNPFTDDSNGKVFVYSNFNDHDTVSIFSTETLYLKIAACAVLKNVTVITSSNRYFNTLTFDDLCDAPEKGFSFKVSFYKTGMQTIRVITNKINGSSVLKQFNIFTYSPLNQDTIKGNHGDVVTLITDSVKDLDVWYNWRFGDTVIRSIPPQIHEVVNTNVFSGTGKIWLTDYSMRFKSPEKDFKYTFYDTQRPKIVIMNELVNDSIYARGNVYSLYINIIDNSRMVDVYVNQARAKEIDMLCYVKEIDLKDLSEKPFKIEITAKDGTFESVKKCYIVFDSSVQSTIIPKIRIDIPGKDELETGRKTWNIEGKIKYYSGDSLSYSVHLNLNDTIFRDSIKIKSSSGGSFEFDSINLQMGLNDIKLTVRDSSGVEVADTSIVMIYNDEYVDTIPPVIASVQVDDVYIWNGDLQKERKIYECENSKAMIKVICFDAGKGVKWALLNGKHMNNEKENKYTWTIEYDSIPHEDNGIGDTITVVDSVDTSAVYSTKIIYNDLPDIIKSPDAFTVVFLKEKYCDTIVVSDDNHEDEIIISPVKNPSTMKFSYGYRSCIIEWTPQNSDSGKNPLQIKINDPSKKSIFFNCTLYVEISSIAPVKFMTKATSVPRVIKLTDSISLPLKVENGKPPFDFKVYDKNTSILTSISATDPVFFWKPKNKSDTGMQQFKITVTDDHKKMDTLNISFLVLPENRQFSITEKWSGSIIDGAILNLGYGTKKDTLTFDINDPDKVHEKHNMHVVLGELYYSVDTESSRFLIILDPLRMNMGYDTLKIIFKDSGGYTKDVIKVLYYGEPPSKITSISPILNHTVTSSSIDFNWHKSYDTDGDLVKYDLQLNHSDNSFKVLKTGLVDTSINLKNVKKAGTYFWNVIGCDSKSKIAGTINTFNYLPVDRVRFDTVVSRLPEFMNCDTLYSCTVKIDSGYPPFNLSLYPLENKGWNFENNVLSWMPDTNDIGKHTFILKVTDSVGNQDTFSFQTTIVGNHAPLLHFYGSFSRNVNGEIVIDTSKHKEVACTLAIEDNDPSPPEMFIVGITLGNIGKIFYSDYCDRIVAMVLKTESITSQKNILEVIVTDRNGNIVTLSEVVNLINSN